MNAACRDESLHANRLLATYRCCHRSFLREHEAAVLPAVTTELKSAVADGVAISADQVRLAATPALKCTQWSIRVRRVAYAAPQVLEDMRALIDGVKAIKKSVCNAHRPSPSASYRAPSRAHCARTP